jgi:hypothetical protein
MKGFAGIFCGFAAWTLLSFAGVVPTRGSEVVRGNRPNQFQLEIAGRAFLGIGPEYERWFSEYVGAGVGLALGVPCVECSASEVSFLYSPLYAAARLPFAPLRDFIFSAGLTLPLFNRSQDRIPFSIAAGYQFQFRAFVLRPSVLVFVTPLPGPKRATGVWFGVQTGAAF